MLDEQKLEEKIEENYRIENDMRELYPVALSFPVYCLGYLIYSQGDLLGLLLGGWIIGIVFCFVINLFSVPIMAIFPKEDERVVKARIKQRLEEAYQLELNQASEENRVVREVTNEILQKNPKLNVSIDKAEIPDIEKAVSYIFKRCRELHDNWKPQRIEHVDSRILEPAGIGEDVFFIDIGQDKNKIKKQPSFKPKYIEIAFDGLLSLNLIFNEENSHIIYALKNGEFSFEPSEKLMQRIFESNLKEQGELFYQRMKEERNPIIKTIQRVLFSTGNQKFGILKATKQVSKNIRSEVRERIKRRHKAFKIHLEKQKEIQKLGQEIAEIKNS